MAWVMGEKRYAVVRHLSEDVLDQRVKSERDARLLKRFLFIRHLYRGLSVEKACGNLGATKKVGYEWLRRWNAEGVQGLVPRYGIGRPSKLDEVQTEGLVFVLGGRNDWTLLEIKEVILRFFNVDYSESRLRIVLKGLGLKHAKPLMEDYRRPVDAEPVLKKAYATVSSIM